MSGHQAVFPVDPQGGGTWVGVNDAGLIVALLNLRPTLSKKTVAPKRSRGLIVLELLRCSSVQQALTATTAFDARIFDPFRVVMVQANDIAVATSPGRAPIHWTQRRFHVPVMFTSSSLGDAVVRSPRQRLFTRMVLKGGSSRWLDGQSRFHNHQWPRRPEISVRMERQDALTVSRTRIDVTKRTRQLLYEAPIDTNMTPGVEPWCSLH